MGDEKEKEGDAVKLYLAGLLFDTPLNRMAELTNIPINQVTPLSLEAMLEDGRHLLAGKIAKSVVRTKLIWAERRLKALSLTKLAWAEQELRVVAEKKVKTKDAKEAKELEAQEEALKKIIDELKDELKEELKRVLLDDSGEGEVEVKVSAKETEKLGVQEATLIKTIDELKKELMMIKPEEGKRKLLITMWREYYHQYRRSVPGLLNHKMALATLTQEELARDYEEEGGEEDFK